MQRKGKVDTDNEAQDIADTESEGANVMLKGIVRDYNGEYLTILAPYNNTQELCRKNIKECEIRLNDGRRISHDQRKKIYATFNDIALYTGYVGDEIKAIMKYEFISRTGYEYFSLSDVDVTTAKEFLQFLVEWCVEHGVPTADNLLDRAPDIARYIYVCLLNKKCCITGDKAELHHEHAVGMGRNRKEIIHKGMMVMPLSRKMHTECHAIGQTTFNDKYHVFGVVCDEAICEVYKL